VLKAQVIGNLTMAISTLLVSLLLMWVVMQLPHPWKLRVPAEGETGPGGLDVYEHGVEAYPSQA
jgi:Amt family ammonium transporter